MKKVLIIAFYFNQLNEIASKRLRALGKYLPQYGWEPIIIIPKIDKLNKEGLNCKIIETPYEDMVDKWLNLIKRTENNNETKPAIKDSKSVDNKALSNLIKIFGEIFAYPDGMKYWKKPAIEASSKIIETEKIDAIISSSFPITSHLIGYELKEKYNIPWIADLRDLWNLNPYINHTHIRTFFENRLENKILNTANILTTTSELSKETLQTLHPENKIESVLSGYEEDEIKTLKKENIEKNNKLTITYAGTLYSGKRDPTILFKALTQLINEEKIDKGKIELNFYGDSDNLKELSKKYEIDEIVKIHGFIPHNEVLKKQYHSDILLLLSWNNPKEKIFIPGKFYEYLGMEKPILSLGYEKGSLNDLIKKLNVGKHTSDLNSTKSALLEFYNEFISTGKVEFKSEENIKQYTMQAMAENFSKLLDEIVEIEK